MNNLRGLALREATARQWAYSRSIFGPFISHPSTFPHDLLPGEVLDPLGFEAVQDLAGTVGDLAGQTSETGNVDAVGGGLGAGLDAVEKDDLAAHLLDGRLVVRAAGQNLRKPCELVVVGRKERQGLHVVVQVLGDGPGEAHPVVGRGATPDLV